MFHYPLGPKFLPDIIQLKQTQVPFFPENERRNFTPLHLQFGNNCAADTYNASTKRLSVVMYRISHKNTLKLSSLSGQQQHNFSCNNIDCALPGFEEMLQEFCSAL
jgi:hypothetical protein